MGLFGYEIVPDQPSHMFLTLGCTATGGIVLRRTSYGAHAPGGLRLAAIDGRPLSEESPPTAMSPGSESRFSRTGRRQSMPHGRNWPTCFRSSPATA